MEVINVDWKNCYITSRDSNDYTRQWTDSRTSNTTIEIAPFFKFPQLSYSVINTTHYQWCGPMLLIVEYIGRLTQNRIKLNPFLPNMFGLIQSLFKSSTSMVLTSFAGTRYYEFILQNKIDHLVKISSYIEFTDTSKILAHTKKGNLIIKNIQLNSYIRPLVFI